MTGNLETLEKSRQGIFFLFELAEYGTLVALLHFGVEILIFLHALWDGNYI